jgi:hypothetical protein
LVTPKGHIRFRDPPCPEGQVGLGVNPTLNAVQMLSVQCVLVNEKASKTLLFCCWYATGFSNEFLADLLNPKTFGARLNMLTV